MRRLIRCVIEVNSLDCSDSDGLLSIPNGETAQWREPLEVLGALRLGWGEDGASNVATARLEHLVHPYQILVDNQQKNTSLDSATVSFQLGIPLRARNALHIKTRRGSDN